MEGNHFPSEGVPCNLVGRRPGSLAQFLSPEGGSVVDGLCSRRRHSRFLEITEYYHDREHDCTYNICLIIFLRSVALTKSWL